MQMNKDIEKFTKWALSVGCSMDKIPKRDQLRRMFTSKQMNSLKNMMVSIRHKDEIKNIRENIFVNKMKKVPVGVVAKSKSELKNRPEELKQFEKIEKFMKQIKDDNTNELKIKQERLAIEVKHKNVKRAQQKNELKYIKTRTEVYKLKQPEVEKNIRKENEDEKRCEEIYKKIKYDGASESSAVLSINNCLADLKEFYSEVDCVEFDASTVCHENNTEQIWNKLRKHFGSMPNSILWSVLDKLNENFLNSFAVWQKNCVTDKCLDKNAYLMKHHSDHIHLNIEIFNVNKQKESESENYIEFYNNWVFDIQTKMRILNGDEKDQEETINSYVLKMIAKIFNEGQIAFLESEIKRATIEIEKNRNIVEDHERLIKSTNQLYLDVQNSADKIQTDISQLYQIKDKLLYLKNTMATVMQKHTRKNYLMVPNGNKTFVNNMSGSFGMNDSVLCSTKIDCNMEMDAGNRLDSTMIVPSTTNSQTHSKELNIFAEISLEKFFQLNHKNSFVTSNQLIFNLNEDQLKTLPCHLLTSEGLFDFIKLNCQQSTDLQQLRRETFKTDFDLIEVNETALNKLCDDQNNNIIEKMDKINGCRNAANVLLDKTKMYLNYLKTNPLEQFIPNTKLFNGRPFVDYKAQFLLYSRLSKE